MRPLRGGGVLWEALPDRHQGGQGHVCLLERGAWQVYSLLKIY
jgi:hypothetical protein